MATWLSNFIIDSRINQRRFAFETEKAGKEVTELRVRPIQEIIARFFYSKSLVSEELSYLPASCFLDGEILGGFQIKQRG